MQNTSFLIRMHVELSVDLPMSVKTNFVQYSSLFKVDISVPDSQLL